jgi:membrane-bound lytic murein transglycosylase A
LIFVMPGRGLPVRFAALAALALLAACGRVIPPGSGPPPVTRPTPVPNPTPSPTPPPATTAAQVGVSRGVLPPLDEADAAAALASFRDSCPALLRRNDASGLTRGSDWQQACAEAATWPAGQAAAFFAARLEPVRVGNGSAFATGYFEPEIAGVRVRQPGYDVPVYRLPSDLVRGWPDDIPLAERKGNPPLGRYDESGRFVQYYERAEIEDGALAGKGLEIAWAADPAEFFFLQVQGSGRLRAPDGSVMRIGYAGQNGREYAGIGSIMRERGLIGTGPGQYAGSMQGILQYIREHPAEGAALMRQNKSWIFFRELTGDGPLGALGVPVRGRSSVAADPAFTPLGTPVFLTMDRAEANGLWIAQDTGGAIKGANRFDTFWGAGDEARRIAGGMSARGNAVLLLPLGTLARLTAQ